MDIFSRKHLKRPTLTTISPVLNGHGGAGQSDCGEEASSGELDVFKVFFYTMIGGFVGFFIRFIVDIAGFDRWLYTGLYLSPMIAWGFAGAAVGICVAGAQILYGTNRGNSVVGLAIVG